MFEIFLQVAQTQSTTAYGRNKAYTIPKAGERGGGQNTWGPDWFGGPEILIKHLVTVLLSRGLGACNA